MKRLGTWTYTFIFVYTAELDMGLVTVGSGRDVSGWVTKFSVFGGSGPVSKISNKYTTYTQETDYSTAIIHNDKL